MASTARRSPSAAVRRAAIDTAIEPAAISRLHEAAGPGADNRLAVPVRRSGANAGIRRPGRERACVAVAPAMRPQHVMAARAPLRTIPDPILEGIMLNREPQNPDGDATRLGGPGAHHALSPRSAGAQPPVPRIAP